MRVLFGLCAALIVSPVSAQPQPLPHLGVNIDVAAEAIQALVKQAMGVRGVLVPAPCPKEHVQCVWSAAGGVRLSISTVEQFDKSIQRAAGLMARQIEVSFNRNSPSVTPDAPHLFLKTCDSIVRVVAPKMPRKDVAALVRDIALLMPTKPLAVDVDRPRDGVLFYGMRNRPNLQSPPNDAFVQCGAVVQTVFDDD